jgi:mono/diheme cytochrome c family protein
VVAGQARAAGRWSADLELRHSTSGLRARRVDGRLVARLSLSVPGGWRGEPGTTTPRPVAGSAVLVILDDVALLYAAIDRMRATTEADTPLFSDRPFSRTTLIRALEASLGLTARQWCCAQPMRAERARLETKEDLTAPRPAAGPGQPAVRLLERHCATCHRTSGPFPPNFLAGEPAQVQSRIAHCAERIFVRLSMWRLHADARPKAPMPPVAALAALPVSPEDWTTSADLRAMTEHVAGILRAQTGRTPRIEDLAGVNYEELRACLPGRARQARSAGP